MQTARGDRARVAWLDAARGIGIVLVVAGHAERGLVAAGLASSPLFGLADRAVYTFHMPLFMLLAGVNVPGSLAKGTPGFLRAKAWTVAYPYLLWSVIQGGLLATLSSLTNSHADWSQLAAIGWRPISPFWFLYALFVFLVLAALIRSAAVLVALAIGGQLLSGLLTGESLAHQMAYMLAFFVVGMLGSGAIRALALPWYAAPLLALAWLAALQIVPAAGPTPYLTPVALPAAVAGIALVLALSQAAAGATKGALVALGEASMSIYVMHILATAGTRIALVELHWPLSQWTYLAACTGAGVLGPLAAHHALQRLGLLPALGLARAPLRRAPRVRTGLPAAEPLTR